MSIAGTTGAIISPFIRLATAKFTMFLMTIVSLVGAGFLSLLSETKGKPMKIRI